MNKCYNYENGIKLDKDKIA